MKVILLIASLILTDFDFHFWIKSPNNSAQVLLQDFISFFRTVKGHGLTESCAIAKYFCASVGYNDFYPGNVFQLFADVSFHK